jgi:hypothetical protein
MGELVAFPAQATHEPWVSKRRLAVYWGCSTKTIERHVKHGGLPSRDPEESPTNRRMFRISECDDWLKKRKAG